MATNAASVVGGLGTFLISLLVLCFDLPSKVVPDRGTSPVRAERVHSSHESGPIHARAKINDVGNGKRLTLQLDFRVDEAE